MVAIVENIKEHNHFRKFLQNIEKQDYEIHLFEEKDKNSLRIEYLEYVISYLKENYKIDGPVSLLSNSKDMIFSWYNIKLQYINEYILYNEKFININENDKNILQQLKLSYNPSRKYIKVFFKKYEDIIELFINYSQCIELYDIDEYHNFNIVEFIHNKFNISYNLIKIIYLQFYDIIGQVRKEVEILNNIYSEFMKSDYKIRKNNIDFINQIIKYYNPRCRVIVYSLLFSITKNKKYILHMINKNILKKLSIKEIYTIYWSIKRLKFVRVIKFSLNEEILFRRFYNYCLSILIKNVKMPKYINSSLRNKNRIVIITNQLLNIGHAPTRNIIDYSINLKELGKEVLIINSADCIKNNCMPFYNAFVANYIEQYSNVNFLRVDDKNIFKFYQSKDDMPNYLDIQNIINLIYEFNPLFVFSLGDCFVGDICSEFTDVVSMIFGGGMPACRYSNLAITRKALPEDSIIMKKIGVCKDKTFQIHYTFMKKDKISDVSRRKLNIPEDVFVLCIVGNRLNEELTEDYILKLKYILEKIDKVTIVFIGEYSNYKLITNQYSIFLNKSISLGYRQDIQSIYSICNLYLNPPRFGGATSAAEALIEGLPVITQPSGDVFNQLWLDDSFNSKETIVAFIEKCIKDTNFYKKQRIISKKLGESLFDTNSMMKSLLSNIDKIMNKK